MAGMPQMLEVGARVRTLRKHLGLHRRRVAQSAGLSRRQLASIERGRRQPTIDQVRSIAGSLGVEVDEFLPDFDEPAPSDLRIDDILEDVPPVDPLSADETPSGPRRERRKAPRAEAKLERSFAKVRAEFDDVARCCDQIAAADAEDDIGPLLDELQAALTQLRVHPQFSVAVERHRIAIATYATAMDVADAASWRSRANQPARTTPIATSSSTTEAAPA
jgi:transcriptional regulator with XRE-family HTH domain